MFITLDQIVSSVLLKTGKSLHWYVEYLSYGLSGVKFLSINTIGQINAVRLPVNSYKAVEIPVDFVDWVFIGTEAGERGKSLILDEGLNRLYKSDGNGNAIAYPLTIATGIDTGPSDAIAYGMNFGLRNDRNDFRFKVIREREEIQLSADFALEEIYLEYISDGQHVDACSKINTLAGEALEKYILWQAAVHSRSKSDSERREAERRFNDQWRYLRAANNAMTPDEIVYAVRSGYSPLSRI